MTRIALIGAGSIGIITGALIAKRGYDIELFDANAANVAALNESGARLVGNLDETVPVTAKLPSEAEGIFDLVILLTKQVFTEQALAPFLPLLSEDGIVLTLQNGTPEDKVAEIVGRERTLAGNILFAAIWKEPGVSQLAATHEYMLEHAFDVGELDGSVTDRLKKVAEILSSVGGTRLSENITGTKWSKLLINATFSGLSAALGGTFGDVIDDPVALRTAVYLMDESIRAGEAHGIRIENWDVSATIAELKNDGPLSVERRMELFAERIEASRPGTASMLQDLEKGIPSERDYIPGRVIEVARQYGIETPYMDLIYRLISEAEQQGAVPQFETGREQLLQLLEARGEA